MSNKDVNRLAKGKLLSGVTGLQQHELRASYNILEFFFFF